MKVTTKEDLLCWTKTIHAVELSPEGERFVVAGNARTARLYDDRAELLAELDHFDCVRCVAFRPDGELFATGSDDMGVRLWSRDGERVALLRGHRHAVDGIAWSAEGSALGSASRDGSVRVWTVTRDGARERWVAAELASRPTNVAWFGDGWLIGTEEGVELRDQEGELVRRAATGFVRQVHASQDGRLVAAAHLRWHEGQRLDTVTIWDGDLDELWSGEASLCAFAADGRTAVADADSITLLSLPNGAASWSARPHDGGVLAIASHGDGVWVTGGNDALSCVLSADGRVAGVMHHDHVVRFCRSSSTRVLSATAAGTVTLWSVGDVQPAPAPRKARAPVARFELASSCNSVAFSGDGRRFALSAGNQVELRRASDGEVTNRFEAEEPTWLVGWEGELISARLQDSSVRRLWWAPTRERLIDLEDGHRFSVFAGRIAVVGGERVRVYRMVGTPPAFELLAAHDANPHATAVSPSARYVFIAGRQGGQLLDTSTGEARGLAGGSAMTAAFSPDESRLAVGGDGPLRLWRMEALDQPCELELGRSFQIAWSPTGQRLGIAHCRTTSRRPSHEVALLWADGRVVASIGEPGRGAVNPVFSRDGQILATGGRDGPAALWRADDGVHIADLGGLATSNIKVVPVAGGARWLTHAHVQPARDLLLRLWTREGAPVAALPGHRGDKWWQVNVSPCGNWVISIVWGDAGPRVWNAGDGSLWGLLEGHGQNVRVGVFAPADGRGRVVLATADDDGGLALWHLGDG